MFHVYVSSLPWPGLPLVKAIVDTGGAVLGALSGFTPFAGHWDVSLGAALKS